MLNASEANTARKLAKKHDSKEYLHPSHVEGTNLEYRPILRGLPQGSFIVDKTAIQRFMTLRIANGQSEPE